MNINEDTLLAYFGNELTPEERLEVEEALHEDPQLKQLARSYERLFKGFRQKRLAATHAQLEGIKKTLPPPNTGSSGFSTPLYGFLGLLFILLAGFWAININYSNKALAKKHYQPPLNPMVAGSQEMNTLLQGIQAFFVEEDFERADSLLTTILSDRDLGAQAQYFLAHAKFKAEDFQEASSIFGSMRNNPSLYSTSENKNINWNYEISRLANGQSFSSNWLEENENPDIVQLRNDLNSIWRYLVW